MGKMGFYNENEKYQKLKRAMIQMEKWDLMELILEIIFEARMDAVSEFSERLSKK